MASSTRSVWGRLVAGRLTSVDGDGPTPGEPTPPSFVPVSDTTRRPLTSSGADGCDALLREEPFAPSRPTFRLAVLRESEEIATEPERSTPTRAASRGRRGLTAGILALALAASVLAVGLEGPPSSPSCGSSIGPSPHPTTPLRHLFFLIKENHAFENYFATLPGVAGNPPTGTFPISYTSNQTISPYPLDGSTTADLPHDHGSLVAAVDGGRMDHFVAQAAADGYPDPNASVGYYTARQIPQYFAYAQNFTLADQFFSGILGPTLPNRLFDLAATSDGWTTDETPPPGRINVPTILDQLTARGLPWAYDYSGVETNLTPLNFPTIVGQPCALSRIQPMGDLMAQLTSPNPPAVTFLDPSHDPLYSEHPPQNVSMGAQWTAAVVNAILSSPVGASSAIFVFYDENGGYWDPVPPPVVDSLGDGVRVPLLVVSPWTPAHSVDHEQLDPAGLLRFVDQDFALPFLNARVANASPLSGFFDFSHPPRPPVLIPTPLTSAEALAGPSASVPALHPGRTGALESPFSSTTLASPLGICDPRVLPSAARYALCRRETRRSSDTESRAIAPLLRRARAEGDPWSTRSAPRSVARSSKSAWLDPIG